MKRDLKELEDQVIVITGASSGIGLTTARMAAKRGARLVLAARSEDALAQLTEEITQSGGEAVYVVADVSDRDDVREIARTAREAFGGFDSWVNNAGVFIYGRLQDVPVEDMRRLFETNVWGTVYGSLEAVDHLKDDGGALINVGSVVSDRSLLLQGSYSASKHAVKGFTDALRMELEREGAPVSVTLVKPSGIDTPYPYHAKNHMQEAADLPPPVYAPETVARAILHSAQHPERDVFVGGGSKAMSALGYYAPSFMDSIMERLFVGFQTQEGSSRPHDQNTLDGPAEDLEERGGYEGHVSETSLYTRASLRPIFAGVVLAGIGVAAAAVGRLSRSVRGADEATE